MTFSNLIRLGGLAAVLAGTLLVLAELLYLVIGLAPPSGPEYFMTVSYALQVGFFLLGGLLLLAGLVGLYTSQSEAVGVLGLVGFAVALLGTGMILGFFWDNAFATPALAQTAPDVLEVGAPTLVNLGVVLSFVLFALGWILFGVATLRAGVYPRAAAVVLAVGALLAAIPMPFSFILFAVAVAWLGIALLTGRNTLTDESA